MMKVAQRTLNFFSFIFQKSFSFLETPPQKGMAGIWEDEDRFIEVIRSVKDKGFRNMEAISPFPLHAIDEAMKIKRSFIPWVTFIFGSIGFIFGLWFTWWTSTVDWPLNIGGKPMWSLPAFVPIIFELTILFAALSSVVSLLFICGLPHSRPPIINPDLSSHKFALFVAENDSMYEAQTLEKLFQDNGAIEIVETTF